MRILLFDLQKSWRGGQNQVRLLAEGLIQLHGVKVWTACPKDSVLYEVCQTPKVAAEDDLVRFCEDQFIDIIDAQCSISHAQALRLKQKLPHIKVLVHRRVDDKPSFFRRSKYHQVDGIIAISEAIKEVLMACGIREEKIHVARSCLTPFANPVTTRQEAKSKIQQSLNELDPSKVWISTIAAMTAQKDHATLIRSVSMLQENGYDFECLLVGDGKLRRSLEQLASKLGARVHFLGFRDNPQIFYEATDIFALSSKNEGLGTALLDAAQAGCAVAATRVGGIPEIIRHEINGLLSPPKNPATLYENLLRLLSDAKERESFAENLTQFVQNHFSYEKMIQANLKIYEATLNAS
jgi:L-malate glycosyltransferase